MNLCKQRVQTNKKRKSTSRRTSYVHVNQSVWLNKLFKLSWVFKSSTTILEGHFKEAGIKIPYLAPKERREARRLRNSFLLAAVALETSWDKKICWPIQVTWHFALAEENTVNRSVNFKKRMMTPLGLTGAVDDQAYELSEYSTRLRKACQAILEGRRWKNKQSLPSNDSGTP